jgi:hypothetical protein
MNKENRNLVNLDDNELDNIVGGLHYYVDKSHPVTGNNGKLCYRMYSCSKQISGDWQNLFNGKGASRIEAHISISQKLIPIEKYAAFCEHYKDKHTFHEC